MGKTVKRKFAVNITGFGLFVLVSLMMCSAAYADKNSADVNDPNEFWWRKWDAVIKDPNDPNELLREKWNAIARVLQDKKMEQELKGQIIDKIISPVFDFPLMARLALGKQHWPKLTERQRVRFTQLFTERLKNSYLEKIKLYKDEKLLFKPAVRQKSTVLISATLASEQGNVAMLYKLRSADEQWKIYDVEIQGVSILLTYRSQFDDILNRGTVKDLLSQLEKTSAQ